MKKFIFLFSILVGAGLLIFISFGRDLVTKKEPLPPIDFSEGHKLYTWNANAKSFLLENPSGQKSATAELSFERFSPVDGIYYASSSKNPVQLTKNGNLNTVTLGSGLFVCNIQTGFEKYEFALDDLTLVPKGRGVFMVDTRGTEVKVFSFDTFIDVSLINGAKRTRVTNFTLFPSLLFKHDPKNTQNLRAADILRISLIDSIRYMDMNIPEERKLLLGSEEGLILDIQEDINHRFHAFKDLYETIVENKTPAKTNGTAFFDTSSPIFINDSKKAVFLKNELITEIVPFFNNQKKASIGALTKTLADMKELDPRVYAEWLAILKQYYYIVRFAQFTDETERFDASSPEIPLVAFVEKTVNPASDKKGEYYIHLSDLFSLYYFSSLKQEGLNSYLESILQKILDSKVLSEDEFLPFVFFTTQYLSTGPALPNEDTMQIIDHLFHITNEYYTKNKADSAKITTITSTIFYNYTKIFSKLYGIFVSTFVDKTPQGLLLKTDYAPGGSKELSSSFVETFTAVMSNAKKDTENKRDDFYATGSVRIDSQVVDSYTLLQATIKPFDTFVSMFNNYQKYLNDFHLNDSNRTAQGILVDTGSEMSSDILKNYLKNFNNLDLSSLQILNNFQKDGFYEIQVNILGNAFHFKLWEQDHAIAEISYIDTFGQKKIFPNASISLDQKEKQLRELSASTADLTLQYKYDFKNFFETTFLRSDTALSPSVQPSITNMSSGDTNSPEIQLFVQRELLDKDFKNIASFLPIEFKNITASIDAAGEYVIEINNVNKTFSGKGKTYTVEMSGKYLFKRHAFSRLAFKVRKEGDQKSYDFNAITIEILPARISLLTVPDTLKDLGYYLDTIWSAYNNGQSIILDLSGKKAIIDTVQIPVNIPTE